jgi:hypothetical protein
MIILEKKHQTNSREKKFRLNPSHIPQLGYMTSQIGEDWSALEDRLLRKIFQGLATNNPDQQKQA